jgi:hypothetical protein
MAPAVKLKEPPRDFPGQACPFFYRVGLFYASSAKLLVMHRNTLLPLFIRRARVDQLTLSPDLQLNKAIGKGLLPQDLAHPDTVAACEATGKTGLTNAGQNLSQVKGKV